MAYEKQNFKNGQVLYAEQLDQMEKGISDAVASACIHVGPNEPADDNIVAWIDTDEEPENPSAGKDGGVDVTAKVGQTIIVTAVDKDGKPTAWEAVDYQPRTHWVEGSQTLLFEGDTDSGGNIEDPAIDGIFMKAGETYELEWDGVVYRDTARYLYEVLGIEPYSDYTLPDGSNIRVTNYDIVWGDLSYYFGGEPTMPVSIDSTDTYMRLYNMGGGSGVRHIAIYGVEVVHKIDPKFLPDTAGGGLQHKRYTLNFSPADFERGSTSSVLEIKNSEKDIELRDVCAELINLNKITINITIALPNMGELATACGCFIPVNNFLSATGTMGVASDGTVFPVGVGIKPGEIYMLPADYVEFVMLFGCTLHIDVLYL